MPGRLLAEHWEPSLLPLAAGTPGCGCPRMSGRTGELLDTPFAYPMKNVSEEEPGADPAVIAADGVPGN